MFKGENESGVLFFLKGKNDTVTKYTNKIHKPLAVLIAVSHEANCNSVINKCLEI